MEMIIGKELDICDFEFEVEDLDDLKRHDHDLLDCDYDLLIYDNLYKNLNFDNMSFYKNIRWNETLKFCIIRHNSA